MLPRSSTKREVGPDAASWARRRTEPVATVAPGAQVGERRADERVARRRAARGTAASASPSARLDGRSLAECTATSARPSSTARCTSLTNTPWPPIVCSGTSAARVAESSRRTPARRRARVRGRAARRRRPAACVRAWALPRVARRSAPARRHASAEVEQVAHGGGVALALRRAGVVPCRRTDGSCSSLATMPLVTASTRPAAASSRPASAAGEAVELGRRGSSRPCSCSWATSGAAWRAVASTTKRSTSSATMARDRGRPRRRAARGRGRPSRAGRRGRAG